MINPMPIRILVIGDSLANGTNEYNRVEEYEYYLTGDANPNTLFEWDGVQLVEIEKDIITANKGSQYPSMANKLKELTGRPTHLVETALGGTGFARVRSDNWTSTGNMYAPMLIKANDYLASQNVAKFDIIKLIGGTNDVNSSATEVEIEEDINDLIVRLHADFPDTKIVYSNVRNTSSKFIAVRGFIQNIIDTDTLVFSGADLVDYSSEPLANGLHLMQYGNEVFGEEDAGIINVLL